MIFKAEKLERVVVEKPRGGEGDMVCLHAIQMGKGPEGSPFQVVANQTLQPGCSVGFHQHIDNEDLYIILSGHGTYLDDDKSETAVKAGDMTLATKGHSHGLKNTGTEPLVFIAVVAKGC